MRKIPGPLKQEIKALKAKIEKLESRTKELETCRQQAEKERMETEKKRIDAEKFYTLMLRYTNLMPLQTRVSACTKPHPFVSASYKDRRLHKKTEEHLKR